MKKHFINERWWRNRYFYCWFAEIVGGTSYDPNTNREPVELDIPQEYIHPDGGIQMPDDAPEEIKARYERLNEIYHKGFPLYHRENPEVRAYIFNGGKKPQI